MTALLSLKMTSMNDRRNRTVDPRTRDEDSEAQDQAHLKNYQFFHYFDKFFQSDFELTSDRSPTLWRNLVEELLVDQQWRKVKVLVW